jgi:hypothetical protein
MRFTDIPQRRAEEPTMTPMRSELSKVCAYILDHLDGSEPGSTQREALLRALTDVVKLPTVDPEIIEIVATEVPSRLLRDTSIDGATLGAAVAAAVRRIVTRPDTGLWVLQLLADACDDDVSAPTAGNRARRAHWLAPTPVKTATRSLPPAPPIRRRSRWALPVGDRQARSAYFAEIAGLCLFLLLVCWLFLR